jgi:hypothetical protein
MNFSLNSVIILSLGIETFHDEIDTDDENDEFGF